MSSFNSRTMRSGAGLLSLAGSMQPRKLGLLSLMSTRLFSAASNSASTTNTVSASATSAAVGECVNSEECKPKGPIEYFRADYKPSPYQISKIYLDFKLEESETIVTGRSILRRRDLAQQIQDLSLDGEELELLEVSINNIKLTAQQYRTEEEKLIILAGTIEQILAAQPNVDFELITKVRIRPDKNLALSGLYKSGASGLLCTQCEAMGFRRITYYLDRPDVLSVYEVRLEGDKTKYPILLSNGNKVASGDIAGTNSHYAVWEDPFPKPSYLFALVAGDLASIHDTYKTTSGKIVQLGIYSDKENGDKLDHAMYSLKESMKWDEDTFNLECDVDIYNVVATNEFNMGAM